MIFNKVRERWYQEYQSEDQGRKDELLSISVNAIDDEAVGACGDQVDEFQQWLEDITFELLNMFLNHDQLLLL